MEKEKAKNQPAPRRSFLRRYWFLLIVVLHGLAAVLLHINIGIPQPGETVILPLLGIRPSLYTGLWLMLPVLVIIGLTLMIFRRRNPAPARRFPPIITITLLGLSVFMLIRVPPGIIMDYRSVGSTIQTDETDYQVMAWSRWMVRNDGFLVLACEPQGVMCQVEASQTLNDCSMCRSPGNFPESSSDADCERCNGSGYPVYYTTINLYVDADPDDGLFEVIHINRSYNSETGDHETEETVRYTQPDP